MYLSNPGHWMLIYKKDIDMYATHTDCNILYMHIRDLSNAKYRAWHYLHGRFCV